MKTKTNLPELRTLDDIVFENRNKAYGAYALNKKHRKYLLIAFFISLTGVSTAIAVPFFKALNGPHINRWIDNTIVAKIDRLGDDVIPPPPPPPPVPLDDAVKQAVYTAPIIVDEDMDEGTLPTFDEAIINTKNDPVPELIPTNIAPEPAIPEVTDAPLSNPQEFASFMNGDINEFRKWVGQNVKYPELASQNQISGKAIVSFCVSVTGEVVDVELIRGVDKSIDEEIMKVIASSPRWRAARQGGIPVKQRFIIPVVFVLNKG